MISTTVKTPTPIAAKASPPSDRQITVTIAAAAELTKLLQTRISPIRRSGCASSFSAARAPALPSRARWRNR